MVTQNQGSMTGTAAALGTIQGCRGKGVIFKYVTNGSETVSVTGIVGGAVASTGKIMCYALITGALHSTVDMAAATYYVPYCYTDNLIVTASGSSDTKTVTYCVMD